MKPVGVMTKPQAARKKKPVGGAWKTQATRKTVTAVLANKRAETADKGAQELGAAGNRAGCQSSNQGRPRGSGTISNGTNRWFKQLGVKVFETFVVPLDIVVTHAQTLLSLFFKVLS
jgi:hypothetical protein